MKDIIFCDIDGTLVDGTRGLLDISEKTRYAIKEVKKRAYFFVITGRAKCIVPKGIIDSEPDGYILSNGAYIEFNHKIIYHNPIIKLEQFREYCEKTSNIYMFVNQENCFVKDTNNHVVRDFIRSMSYDPSDIIMKDSNIERCDFIWIYSDSEEKRKNFEREFSLHYEINRQLTNTFDCANIGVNKGDSIKYLLDNINVQVDKSYCFGDGLNDIGMMKVTDHSFCMNNGNSETKKVASEIIDDVIDDGFYKALLKHNFIESIIV